MLQTLTGDEEGTHCYQISMPLVIGNNFSDWQGAQVNED